MQAIAFEEEFDEEGFNAFFGANETTPETPSPSYEDLTLRDVMEYEEWIEEGDTADNYPLLLLN